MTKRIIAILLVLSMLFACCACGIVIDDDDEPNQSGQTEVVDDSKGGEKQPEKDPEPSYVEYRFRSSKLLNQHYEKHGIDMGFKSAKDYEKAASDVINNPKALHKTEKEDGDYVYYVEKTNEFVVLSTDGYIRTYFLPDAGKKYYDKQ